MVEALYLCGTVHLDLVGPARLRKVLETVKPDYVAIESYPALSRDILEKRKEFKGFDAETLLKKFKDKSKVPTDGVRADSVLAISNCVGYEVWVPFGYAEKSGAQIIHIEDKGIVQRLTKSFLEDVLSDPEKAQGFVELLKQSPSVLKSIFDFSYEFNFQEDGDPCEMVNRNKIFAGRIGDLSGRVLTVTGVGHVYGEEPTLQTLLKEYDPVSFKLIHADHFDSADLDEEH